MQRKIQYGLIFALWLLACSLAASGAFFSDCQSNTKVLGQVVEQMVKFKPNTVFIGGDITLNGSRQDDFTAFFKTMKPLTDIATLHPAMGNHDKDTELFLKNFPQVDSLTYYTVEWERVLWIILNSNLKMAPGSAEYNWLLGQLEQYKDRTKVIVMHHPVYSSGAHGDEKGFQFILPQLLSKYHVSAVFSGHDHIYERSVRDSVQYVVFGGAGGELYDNVSLNDYSLKFIKTNGFLIFNQERDEMMVKAIDLTGKEIDAFSFAIKPRPEYPLPEQE